MVSAERVFAERIKEAVRSVAQISALPLNIDWTFNSGLLSDVFVTTLQRPARVCSFLRLDPRPEESVDVSRSWGLASLMRCAERTVRETATLVTKKRA